MLEPLHLPLRFLELGLEMIRDETIGWVHQHEPLLEVRGAAARAVQQGGVEPGGLQLLALLRIEGLPAGRERRRRNPVEGIAAHATVLIVCA